MKHNWTRGEAWGKTTAALFGGFLVFLTFGMAIGTGLPALGVNLNLAVAISVGMSVPVWGGFILFAMLAKNGRHAWLWTGLVTLFFVAVIAVTKLL